MMTFRDRALLTVGLALGLSLGPLVDASADETCNSPYTTAA